MSPRGPSLADIAPLAQECLWKLQGHAEVCRLKNMLVRFKRSYAIKEYDLQYDAIGYLQRVMWWPRTESKPLRVGYWQ